MFPFSTCRQVGPVPESERLALLREFYRRGMVKAEVDPNEGQPLDATFTCYALPEAQLLNGKVVWS